MAQTLVTDAHGGDNPAQISAAGQALQVKGRTGTVVLDRDFLTIKRKGFVALSTVGKGGEAHPSRVHQRGSVEASGVDGQRLHSIHGRRG